MKRAAFVVAVLAVLVGGAAHQGDGKTDKEKIQGDWKLVSQVADGKEEDLPEGGMTLTFKGDKIAATVNGKQDREEPFKLNEGKDPREIDVVKEDLTVRGLYELKGDTLRMAFLEGFEKRPASFTDKGVGVLTFKRVVKK
jgi:uncharacterized protein (TIGR03067 family)